MKRWKVTAEINMDASKYVTVNVKANTKRKAIIIGEEKIKKDYDAFFITNISAVEIKEEIKKKENEKSENELKTLDDLIDSGKSFKEINSYIKNMER